MCISHACGLGIGGSSSISRPSVKAPENLSARTGTASLHADARHWSGHHCDSIAVPPDAA